MSPSAIPSAPVLPNYSGANVRGIVPALLAPRRTPDELAPWIPSLVAAAEQVVLLVLDGLGWEQLQRYRHLAPTLAAMDGGPITTVAPTTTATALTSITTGLTPGEHGVIGYRVDVGGDVLNTLRWATDRGGDARRSHEPARLQPFAPFLDHDVVVVTRAEFERTGFTTAHLRGTRLRGWRLGSGIPVTVADALRRGDPFVYVYYDGIDKVAHDRGFGPFYDAELRAVDRLVADLLEVLPASAALLVTADHGQVDVGERMIAPAPEVRRLTSRSSGEARFRWLHAVPGAAHELLAAAGAAHGEIAWVAGREQILDEGWFGPVVSAPVRARLGDVALVARDDIGFDDPADSGPTPLVCRHGSLTPAEVYVPLVAAIGGAS